MQYVHCTVDPFLTWQGHPDNVAPVIYGGCQLGIHNHQRWITERVQLPPGIQVILLLAFLRTNLTVRFDVLVYLPASRQRCAESVRLRAYYNYPSSSSTPLVRRMPETVLFYQDRCC